MLHTDSPSAIYEDNEKSRVELALESERLRLQSINSKINVHSTEPSKHSLGSQYAPSTMHSLLLLSDSALPLGSFAFSSGLESYLAHHPSNAPFHPFLALSIESLASTALPYVLSAYHSPARLLDLDNDFDASTPCTVARRASVAQGRALLGVWERSLKATNSSSARDNGDKLGANDVRAGEKAVAALAEFSRSTRLCADGDGAVNGHFALLWAVVCLAQGMEVGNTAYVFLLNHAKAVISAAVRASVLGPYAAQGLLASGWLRGVLEGALRSNWGRGAEDAGQCAPVLDLWVGRHELLYSRIFNS